MKLTYKVNDPSLVGSLFLFLKGANPTASCVAECNNGQWTIVVNGDNLEETMVSYRDTIISKFSWKPQFILIDKNRI